MTSSRPFVPSAHALRFLAAALVLVGHVLHETERMDAPAFDPIPWAFGVDVFLVISGFIMLHQFGDRFSDPRAPGEFLLRRLVRIVPIYWIFTTLMVVAMAAMPQFVDRDRVDWLHVAASYLFVPWESPAGGIAPVLVLGWTLNLEMFFYVAFALALRTGSRRRGLTAVTLAFAGLALIHPVVPREWWALRFWSEPIILEFVAGLWIAVLFRRGVRLPHWIAAALALTAVVLLVALHLAGAPRVLGAGVPAALLCLSVLLARPVRLGAGPDRFLRLGGDASYALYLSHPFALTGVFVAWRMLGLELPWLYAAVGVAFSLAAAIVVHVVLERPLQAKVRAALVRSGGLVSSQTPEPAPSPAGLPPEPVRLAARWHDRRR